MKRKLLLLFAALLPMVACAYNAKIDGIYYNFYGNEATVTYGQSPSNSYSGSVVIPASVTYNSKTYRVTSIGGSAFYGCSGLTSVTIPNSVTIIGANAFYNCTALTSITIPEGVTSIGSGAFSGCYFLTNNFINNSTLTNSNYWGAILCDDEFGDGLLIKDNVVVKYRGTSASVIIPDYVTSIGDNAFSSCNGLTSVTIGNNVTSISYYAFSGISIKKTIWLTNTPPSGYTYVRGAINYVSNEQYAELQNKELYPYLSSMFEVEGIKYVPVNPSERTCDAIDCVYGESASNLNIPSTVSYRGISMNVHDVKPYFCYCNKFIKTLSCENTGYIANYAFYGCANMTSLSLGEDVSAIGNSAFQNCSSLRSVNIPDVTAALGGYAFENCSQMTSARIGAGIKTIPSNAFSKCSGLTNIQLGQNVQVIESNVFSGCSALPTITIPKSVNAIGDCAFQSCTALKDFIIDDRENELSLGDRWGSPLFSDCPLDSVYIGGNITYDTSSSYSNSPFYRNKTLRTVVITDWETEISPYEFYGCTNLQSFKIGDGVTSFGDWAFSGCTSLKSLSFGSQLQSIGKEAFSDCTSVTQIVSKTATPPSCSDQALDDINKWDCTLVVPEGSLTAYQGAEQWKQFFFIVEGTGSGDEPDPEIKKCAKPTISYANGKLTFNCETEGAICQSSIKDTDIRSYSDNEVQLGVTYNISVYATKAGFEDSDIATATLCWVDVEPAAEGLTDEDAVAEVKALPVLIQTQGSSITVQGAAEGTNVSVYSVNGMLQGSAIANEGITILNTSLQPGSVAIVKIGDKAVKVMVK